MPCVIICSFRLRFLPICLLRIGIIFLNVYIDEIIIELFENCTLTYAEAECTQREVYAGASVSQS